MTEVLNPMPRRSAVRTVHRRASRRHGRGFRVTRLLPRVAVRKRWWKAFRRAPMTIQLGVSVVAALTLWLTVNWIYQVIRKPSELFFPVSGTLYKTPTETWDWYEPIFRKHSTSVMSAELLAALAQVEGSGNPIVRTYWRWRWRAEPFEVYRPASSAVGMYQITDGTFGEARRYCIHDHVVVEDGPWNAWHSCWFNSLYTRTVPSHAVELTSAYLHIGVEKALRRYRIRSATLRQKQDLATVMHLCGVGAGHGYARRGFGFSARQRCGDHDARAYVARVQGMKAVFTRLAAASS
jgi:hypothetical protein